MIFRFIFFYRTNFFDFSFYNFFKNVLKKIIINQKDDEINSWKNKFEELADEFKNFKKRIQDKIYSLTSKIFEILHIPYSWYEANDIDYAIDTARDYLKRHSKSKDDLER